MAKAALPAVLVVLGACDVGPTGPDPVETSPNPLRGLRLYVDPGSQAALQVSRWASTRPNDAALVARIAEQPQAVWLGGWLPDVEATVRSVVDAAASAGTAPVLVLYHVPRLDCVEGFGAADAGAYRAWVDRVSAGLAGRKAVAIVEPDALGHLAECLGTAGQRERLDLLRYAAERLTAAGAVVYLDAGTAGWIPAPIMASRLEEAGLASARGFSVNVSNFETDRISMAYAEAVAASLDRPVGWVIDTSRNGKGSNGEWCNPDGRALGDPPEVVTDVPGLDGLLWIKRPGESDGTCNGGPPAGTWWPEYALELAANADWT